MVDWVERIPFYETRNYVQRVMENLQVYRKRLAEKLSPQEQPATADATNAEY
jgi:soluble lytic murein transglycosylase